MGEIAERLGGVLEGDPAVAVDGLASLTDAGAGDISFLSNARYAAQVEQTAASAIVVGDDWTGTFAGALIRVKIPDAAVATLAESFGPDPVPDMPGVHETAVIGEGVELGPDVSIGPWCVLEASVNIGGNTAIGAGCFLGRETRIGRDCRLYPNVTIRERTSTGDRCIIHSGAVIGSDGFGYVPENGAWKKIPQIGCVALGDDVEIGANAVIDRARFGTTRIGNGVKIDNLVQVAHNVEIGDHSAMAAQVGISGSTRVGTGVQLGGQAGLAGHLDVGDGAVVGAQAGVTKDVQPGTFVSGYPAMPHARAAKLHACLARLPKLRQRVDALEKELQRLKGEREG